MKRTSHLKRKTPLRSLRPDLWAARGFLHAMGEAARAAKLEGERKGLKRTPLKKSSSKQAGRLKEYAKLREAYLECHKYCEVCGKQPSSQIHHRARRGKNLNDVSNFVATDFSCHQRIHNSPAWARENGWLV